MVVFDLELVPQGPEIRIPKTALRNKLEHKNTDKSEHGGRMRHERTTHDMERCAEIETVETWEKQTRLRCSHQCWGAGRQCQNGRTARGNGVWSRVRFDQLK